MPISPDVTLCLCHEEQRHFEEQDGKELTASTPKATIQAEQESTQTLKMTIDNNLLIR
jgi:hypothetical protein